MSTERVTQSLGSLSRVGLVCALLGGCASYGEVKNAPLAPSSNQPSYSLKTWAGYRPSDDVSLILSFSGGGTRAAAMAYGILEELRDTMVTVGGQQKRLLDEVDQITSVSGGSFTAAYYGLNGDGIFDTFEEAFLRRNVEKHMKLSLVRPIHWFSRKGRTQRAIDYYQKILFHDATFADMLQPDRPMIVINASDLSHGVRFSFIQGYFDLLCSDLLSFPVASAVAASSAVPVVFNPVVVQNYEHCPGHEFPWPPDAAERAKQEPYYAMLYEGLQSYNDKENRKYIHLVDGGITDNIGLRAVSDVMAVSGGPASLLQRERKKVPGHVVVISVNASTEKETDIDHSNRQPSIFKTISAMSNVQLHRYNTATVALLNDKLDQWATNVSTPGHPVIPHFIRVSFRDIEHPQLKLFLNKIPTSFDLTDEQVDTLIESARVLLRENPRFKKLLTELASK